MQLDVSVHPDTIPLLENKFPDFKRLTGLVDKMVKCSNPEEGEELSELAAQAWGVAARWLKEVGRQGEEEAASALDDVLEVLRLANVRVEEDWKENDPRTIDLTPDFFMKQVFIRVLAMRDEPAATEAPLDAELTARSGAVQAVVGTQE